MENLNNKIYLKDIQELQQKIYKKKTGLKANIRKHEEAIKEIQKEIDSMHIDVINLTISYLQQPNKKLSTVYCSSEGRIY
jgi:predicted  nucleic acid-binding Zn-ribbon protein